MLLKNFLDKIKCLVIFFLYNIFLTLLLPFFLILFPFLFLHKRFRYHFWERLGFLPKLKKNSIWIHSASVGEWNGVLPFVHLLLKKGYTVTASAFTDTGLQNLQKDDRISSFLLPFDFFLLQCLLIAKLRPQKIIVTETELWPNLIFTAFLFRVPIYLINARISDKHYHSYYRFRFVYKCLFQLFHKILIQDSVTEKRLTALNIRADFLLTGTTKLDGISKPNISLQKKKEILQHLGAEPPTKIIVAGSTRGSEYQYFIKAFKRLQKEHSPLKLVIAPRHLENIGIYKAFLKSQNLSFAVWSDIQKNTSENIILIDVMGLLPLLYSIADIAFIGGTIEPAGGHNPVEAAVHPAVIVHGSSVSNNPVAFQLLMKNQASVLVTRRNLFSKLNKILSDSAYLEKMRILPYQVLSAAAGVSEKIFSLIFLKDNPSRSHFHPFLLPLSWLYYAGYKIDSLMKVLKQKKLNHAFVISIGNISVGGTGKTPFTVFLADALKEYRPAVLTRGYKSKIKHYVLYNETNTDLYGDEPVLLSRKTHCPIVIDADRYRGAQMVLNKHKLFILDDGFQHQQLYRNIDIVLVDASVIDNDRFLIPAGRLREPVSALKRADYIILNKISMISEFKKTRLLTWLKRCGIQSKQIFTADYSVEGLFSDNRKISLKTMKNKKILAFSGIGNPLSFQHTVLTLFPDSAVRFQFWRDHHKYDKKSLEFLKQHIEAGYVLITTEKDYVKLREASLPVYTIKITFQLFQKQDFIKRIKQQIGEFYEK